MSLSLRFAARSDVGLQREGNEDSGYAGPTLLAVADGMGGHAAGEVASSVAVATLARLEDDVPAGDVLDALSRAVAEANDAISLMVDRDPRLDGMGTTLTALLWAGRKLGLVHVGDSRAYLLRDGQLQQITHDHTFVQTLVDEERITPEEAENHPQRSLLLRALDGRGNPEPDLSVREVRVGDRYLLCSDGLSGVVPFDAIAEALSDGDPEATAEKLVQLALEAGGPDNITCIVADVVESDAPPPGQPLLVGAAAERRNKAANTAEIDLDDAGDAAPPSRRGRFTGWLARGFVALLAAVMVVGAGWAAYAWSQRQYYVGAADGRVTIFRGIPQEIAGRALSEPYEHQDVLLSDLSAVTQANVRDTIFAGDIQEARRIVDRLRDQAAECRLARQRAQRPTPSPAPARPGSRTGTQTSTARPPTALAGVVPGQAAPATRPPATAPPATPTGSPAASPAVADDCGAVGG
jgi:serine/threonine protein phosphatase PrpC